jgi:diguanylate cyclase (GGDEF)-like protein/PAS domain S-box-containing protein
MHSMKSFILDGYSSEAPIPKFIGGVTASTETIDLANIFDPSASGSFRFTRTETGFLGKLLDALPIPALLIDDQCRISFANSACHIPETYEGDMKTVPFASLFNCEEHSDACKLLVDNVLATRKTQGTTALLKLNGRNMWGRLQLRSIRAWQERFVLVLVEDLTLEKEQLVLTKRHEEEMRKAHDELEIRVRSRTAELTKSNKLLKREIQERRRAELELKLSRASFTSIVEESKEGIIIIDQEGAIRYLNTAAWGFFGASAETLAAQKLPMQLDENGAKELAIVRAEGGMGTAEMHITTTDWHGTPAYVAVLRDITDRKSAEEALRESEHRYRQTFNRMRAVKLLIEPETARIVDANPAAAEFYGYSVEQLKGMTFPELNTALPKVVLSSIHTSMLEQQNYHVTKHLLRSGEIREVEIHTGPIELSSGKLLNCIIHDITDRKLAEEKLLLAAKIIESSSEALVTMDTAGLVVDVNEAYSKITGYSRVDVLGHKADVFQLGANEANSNIWETAVSTGAWQGEVWDKRKNGEAYPKFLFVSAVRSNEGVVTHYVGAFSDISKIKAAEKHLQRLAHFDPLTRLPNRLLFRDRLERAAISADRRKTIVGLMFLDLDRFKNVNDTMGHGAGDKLLTQVSERLVHSVRKGDTVARLGGDEFAVVLVDIQSSLDAANVAGKIIQALNKPFNLDDRQVFITASIGITLYPDDGTPFDRLLQNADMALYHAKELGKNNFQFFREAMNVTANQVAELEEALRGAIDRDEFVLYYQPRVNLATGDIVNVEALIRWRRPGYGLVGPAQFISVAEETGAIAPIGEWVLEAACACMKRWHEMGLRKIRVAVNVSGRQLDQDCLVDAIRRVLDKTGLQARFLELELTESVAMKDAERTIDVFTKLKKMGVHISIDDFGTGYSSLSHLKRFPIDMLKIDGSFVMDIANRSDDEAIVKAIIAVGHSLKLAVVAEGVETKEQLALLGPHHCDEWQGFYFSPPVPAEEMEKMLQENRSMPA